MAFQYETPPAVSFPFRIDPKKLDSEFQVNNEPDGIDRWGSSFSFYSTDRVGISSASVGREPYVPKYIEVNYIEGSTDKKWSSQEFSWTRELEVCHTYNLPLTDPDQCSNMLCFLLLSGQQQKSVWKSLLPSQPERGDQCYNEWI